MPDLMRVMAIQYRPRHVLQISGLLMFYILYGLTEGVS